MNLLKVSLIVLISMASGSAEGVASQHMHVVLGMAYNLDDNMVDYQIQGIAPDFRDLTTVTPTVSVGYISEVGGGIGVGPSLTSYFSIHSLSLTDYGEYSGDYDTQFSSHSLVGISAYNYLGSEYGKDFYLRLDLGMSLVVLIEDTRELANVLVSGSYSIRRVRGSYVKPGYGVAMGCGYVFDVGNDLGLNLYLRSTVFPYSIEEYDRYEDKNIILGKGAFFIDLGVGLQL